MRRVLWALWPVLLSSAPAAHARLDLQLPLDCAIGETCFIQNYVDHDQAEGAAHDYTCGHLTYDGHNGTDFRVPTYADLSPAVQVLAVHGGRVASVQRAPLVQSGDIPLLQIIKLGMHTPCGANVRIDHGKGWESTYCHLAPESIAVQEGDSVETGQIIARMGRSGESHFPHLHYELRHYGTPIDPFLGYYSESYDCSPEKRYNLWEAEVAHQLMYVPSGVVAAGFSAEPPAPQPAREGQQQIASYQATAPALHFWIDLYGIQPGDRLQLMWRAPDGTLEAEKTIPYDTRYSLSFESLTATREGAVWPEGIYEAQALLLRPSEKGAANIVVQQKWTVEVKA